MKDEKLIKKLKKELFSIQNKIDKCYKRREKLVEDYTRQLLSFEVSDLETKEEFVPKRH
jgi:hypothetical protein